MKYLKSEVEKNNRISPIQKLGIIKIKPIQINKQKLPKDLNSRQKIQQIDGKGSFLQYFVQEQHGFSISK